MQKIFYCVYIKSDKEKLGTFIENMLTNIVESVQNSSDDTASFMYLFDTNRQAVVGIYSAEKTPKLPASLTMYVNSLNSEAQMMGAIFEDIDTSSSDFDRTRFVQIVSQNIPSSINSLTSILGTNNINDNKPKVSDPESTTDLLAKISEILPQDGVEDESSTSNGTRTISMNDVKSVNPGEFKSQELVLLGEILDKLNIFTSTLTDISNRLGRVEEKLDVITSGNTNASKGSDVGVVLGKQKAEEITSIGGIPEVPTYTDEPEEKQETFVIEEKPVEEHKQVETEVEKLVDEAHKENIAEGSEVATPNEVSIAETQAPSPEDEQSVNGATSTIVDIALTPEIKGGETEENVESGSESIEPKFDTPELNNISKLLGFTDGTESSLHNYIISNRNNLSDNDLDLYCKYDFEESIKQNKLVELDRVTSIKRKLETDRL